MEPRNIFNRSLIFLLILLPILLLLFSCDRRELLDEPSSELTIKINWGQQKVNFEYFYVVLYPRDHSKEIIKNYIKTDGGEIVVPRGEYDVIIYSYDYESIIVNLTDKYETSYLTTSSKNPNSICKYGVNKDEALLRQTDKEFYIGKYEGINIEVADSKYEIEISPENIIKNFEARINIVNPQGVSNVYGIITGLSGYFSMSKETFDNNPVSIYSEAYISGDKLILPFNTFGVPTSCNHTLKVVLTLANGEIQTQTFDIKAKLDQIPNGGVINIDQSIVIPEITGGGLGGTVGGWTEEDGIIIIM